MWSWSQVGSDGLYLGGVWNPQRQAGGVAVGPPNATTIIYTGRGRAFKVDASNGTLLWETSIGTGRGSVCVLHNPWDDTLLVTGSFFGRSVGFGNTTLSSANSDLPRANFSGRYARRTGYDTTPSAWQAAGKPLTVSHVHGSYVDGFIAALRSSDGAVASVAQVSSKGSDGAQGMALQPPKTPGGRPLLWVAGAYQNWPLDLGGAGVLPANPSDGVSGFLASMVPPSASGNGSFLTATAIRATSDAACVFVNNPVAGPGNMQPGLDGSGNVYLAGQWVGPLAFGQLGTYIAPRVGALLTWSFVTRLGNTTTSGMPVSVNGIWDMGRAEAEEAARP